VHDWVCVCVTVDWEFGAVWDGVEAENCACVCKGNLGL